MFRSSSELRVVVENLSCEHGRRYLEHALRQTPELERLLDAFRVNDRLGSPVTCEYGDRGRFAPATLRYVKVLSDLLTLFGSLDGMRILEIGGGYGGQCFVVSVAAAPASYTLVDLEPVLELQRAYLRELDVAGVLFVPAGGLDGEVEYDLVVSNYAFSECVRRVQRSYVARALARSRRGYVTCNWLRPRLTLTPEELLAAVPGSRFVPDEPVVVPGTAILVWGDR
jgi:putative sugar O-methyltransferase